MKIKKNIWIMLVVQIYFVHRTNGQIIPADSVSKEEIKTSVNTPQINPEKLAWDLMLPYNYKKIEKTREMKSFEQMLLRMKSGVGELSLLMGNLAYRQAGFELQSIEKTPRPHQGK